MLSKPSVVFVSSTEHSLHHWHAALQRVDERPAGLMRASFSEVHVAGHPGPEWFEPLVNALHTHHVLVVSDPVVFGELKTLAGHMAGLDVAHIVHLDRAFPKEGMVRMVKLGLDAELTRRRMLKRRSKEI